MEVKSELEATMASREEVGFEMDAVWVAFLDVSDSSRAVMLGSAPEYALSA